MALPAHASPRLWAQDDPRAAIDSDLQRISARRDEEIPSLNKSLPDADRSDGNERGLDSSKGIAASPATQTALHHIQLHNIADDEQTDKRGAVDSDTTAFSIESSLVNGTHVGRPIEREVVHDRPLPASENPSRVSPPTPSNHVPLKHSFTAHPPAPLLDTLPRVDCVVRARIPTVTGAEMYLHLYQNDVDQKEHLAIVFGTRIRSRSLDAVRPGESEMDRMIRGAYTGRLHPGRLSSKEPTSKSRSARNLGQNALLPGGLSSQPMPQQIDEAPSTTQTPLVRIHSECYTGETAWSARCDCGEQLDEAARLMSQNVLDSGSNEPHDPATTRAPESTSLPQISQMSTNEAEPEEGASKQDFMSDTLGSLSTSNITQTPRATAPALEAANDADHSPGGVIVYLRQEGRGIGLGEKLKAYNLQDLGSDTVEANLLLRHPADARSYGIATAILLDLGLGGEAGIRLLTNNPDKVRAVEGMNRQIVVRERVPMIPLAWRTGGTQGVKGTEIEGYLRTKIGKMGHMLS